MPTNSAWVAAPNRTTLRDELHTLYVSLEQRVTAGIDAILESSGRRLLPGLTTAEHASMLMAVTEGAVLQGAVRGHEETAHRYAEYVVFLLEHGSEPID